MGSLRLKKLGRVARGVGAVPSGSAGTTRGRCGTGTHCTSKVITEPGRSPGEVEATRLSPTETTKLRSVSFVSDVPREPLAPAKLDGGDSREKAGVPTSIASLDVNQWTSMIPPDRRAQEAPKNKNEGRA
jgi:hypothetical protein